MTDTSTLAKLSPRADDEPDASSLAARPVDDAGQPERTQKSIAPGTVVRRGMQLFVVAALAFVLFAVSLSGLAHARTQIGLQRQFRSALASNSAAVGGAIPTGAPIAAVVARAIGLNEVVVQGSRSSQLRAGPGHVVGTPLPGQPGNAVIAGRRTLYGGAFRHIASLRPGNLIHVTTGEGTVTYRVTGVAHLASSDGSFVQNHDDNRLTLFTSDSRWSASGRTVATAILSGKPLPPTTLTRTLDADGLGLTGERDAAPYMLVWLEVLAAAALLAAYAASRWSAPRVWLVFAPILAMTIWLVFESFVRLLPATL